jgi:hypothetical protein
LMRDGKQDMEPSFGETLKKIKLLPQELTLACSLVV